MVLVEEQWSARELKSEKEIMGAKTKGDLVVTPTEIVANYLFVQWKGGSMKIWEDKNINDDSKYMGGQVLKIDTDKMVVTMVAHGGFGPDGYDSHKPWSNSSIAVPIDELLTT